MAGHQCPEAEVRSRLGWQAVSAKATLERGPRCHAASDAIDPTRHAPVRIADRTAPSKDIFCEDRAASLVGRARPTNGSDRGVASLARSNLSRYVSSAEVRDGPPESLNSDNQLIYFDI